MEAFSDGVLAIIITIMVLEMRVPDGNDLHALSDLLPGLLSYVLSFIYVGIYWNNHHHMLRAAERVSAGILWANLHLLFWLSLIPFVTRWIGAHGDATIPTASYGVVLLMAAVAYLILQRAILAEHGHGSVLAAALGSDVKGKSSLALYVVAVIAAFMHPWIADGLYAAIALMWMIPDRRIERVLRAPGPPERRSDDDASERNVP